MPPPLPRQQPAPRNPASVVLIVLMWLGWLGAIIIADFLGFMMFAFADSPRSANAAKLMIVPMFVWFFVTFAAGIILLIFRRWWSIPLAFALAISPPFLAFIGYNLLDGVNVSVANINTPPAPPPVRVQQRNFTPTPTTRPVQPDFQKAIRDAQRAATMPATRDQ